MNKILENCLIGIPITKIDVEQALSEICEDVHASCNDKCPVYAVQNKVPLDSKIMGNCICFKNGSEMLKFLQKHGQAANNVGQAPFFKKS